MLRLKSPKDISTLKMNLMLRKATFAVERRGQKTYIVNKNRKAAVYYKAKETTNKYFRDIEKLAIIRKVHQEAKGYIYASDCDIQEITAEYPSMNMDRKRFKQLPDGEVLVSFDLKHAYWLCAYKLGYISPGLYKKYAEDPDYKLGRNIALSTLTSVQERDVYIEGVYWYKIVCEKVMESRMYKNIRSYTYNIIGELHEGIGEGSYGYRVDGVYAINDASIHDFCETYFKKLGLPYDIEYFKKIDDKHIRSDKDGSEKQF